MRRRPALPNALAATLLLVVFASACGSNPSIGPGAPPGGTSSSSSSSGGNSSSGSGSSSGSSSSSGGSSSSGSSSGSGSGGTTRDAGSIDGATPSGGSEAGSGDASIPSGIPTAGTCSKIPVLTGDPIIAKLLAIADPSKCSVVSAHSYQREGGGGGTADICQLTGAVFYQSGMNIDCDGVADTCSPQHCPSDDPTNQSQTSFQDASGNFLSAGLTPYVVIPQDFKYAGLDTKNGGNVIAVIYKNQLEFAVFGDTGPTSIIGEASYATANNLGIDPDPASGGSSGPITYIVFVGSNVAPQDMSNPLQTWQLGMTLAQALVANNP